jgi:hypothetical protein
MPEATWVITTVISAAAAITGWLRWRVERDRNKVLRRQLELAEKSGLPDVRFVEVRPYGGGPGYVDFVAAIQNVGSRPVRAVVSAQVDDQAVDVPQPIYDLTANTPPSGASVRVPRPELAEQMPECGHATTLYGRTLRVVATFEGQTVEETWREDVYDPATDDARAAIQQRYWRRGRGEETSDDLRAESLKTYTERLEREAAEQERYEDV